MKAVIQQIETALNLQIPNDVKIFYSEMKISDWIFSYYDSKEDFVFRLTKYIQFNNILIDTFIEQSNLLETWKRHIALWGRNPTTLPIAFTSEPSNGTIYIRIGDEKIYLSINGYKEHEQVISDSFTNFILACKPIFNENRLACIQFSQLYRNWNEDFWRVRED